MNKIKLEDVVELVLTNKLSREAAEKMIEEATEGDIALAAYRMFDKCGSSREWMKNKSNDASVMSLGLLISCANISVVLKCGTKN